jgi:hypothetical protein
MEIFWAVVVSCVLVLIVYGLIASSIRERRVKRLTARHLPEVPFPVDPDRRYRIQLSNGTVFDEVRILGISSLIDKQEQHVPQPLQRWLVLENPEQKRIFVRPQALRLFEER